MARSTHVTPCPARSNHAAGDASPNGWRPISYVEMSTTLTLPLQQLGQSSRTLRLHTGEHAGGRKIGQHPLRGHLVEVTFEESPLVEIASGDLASSLGGGVLVLRQDAARPQALLHLVADRPPQPIVHRRQTERGYHRVDASLARPRSEER